MKKVLSTVLMLAIILSLSAVAFAGPIPPHWFSPHHSSSDSSVEPEVYEPYYGGGSSSDVDLASVPMASDVSCDNDDVAIYSLANCPDALKETAKQELAALKRSGYKVDCGFVVVSKSNGTAACTVKLSAKDVPDGAEIFVNGAAVQAELKDGYYVFDVTLPAIILVAHK